MSQEVIRAIDSEYQARIAQLNKSIEQVAEERDLLGDKFVRIELIYNTLSESYDDLVSKLRQQVKANEKLADELRKVQNTISEKDHIISDLAVKLDTKSVTDINQRKKELARNGKTD